ncbi:unnamed protein product [Paramecium sonneborni]|uniref:Uncharacterized protein n=1 Tax=Paramecium sonneborni TaxID=65129 RepID=A0A8S1MNX4_9CILI|nr:unnamed protein product [Paramecium sonneborni]
MLEDDDVEIIHSTNIINDQYNHQQNQEFIRILKIQHQKLLSSNQSLVKEVQQYKDLLEQSIDSLRQLQKDQNILKSQLSQKEAFVLAQYPNSNELQKTINNTPLIKFKDSSSNKDSLGNKYTNVSSNYGYINSSLNSRHTYSYDIFISQVQPLNQSIKNILTILKASEITQISPELWRFIQEFEENLNVFVAIQDQFMFEIHRNIVDQTEQRKELQEQSISSDTFNSQQGQQSQIFQEDLDTSQFENEVQIKQQFESFEISLAKLSDEEKRQWKEQLLQLINTL